MRKLNNYPFFRVVFLFALCPLIPVFLGVLYLSVVGFLSSGWSRFDFYGFFGMIYVFSVGAMTLFFIPAVSLGFLYAKKKLFLSFRSVLFIFLASGSFVSALYLIIFLMFPDLSLKLLLWIVPLTSISSVIMAPFALPRADRVVR